MKGGDLCMRIIGYNTPARTLAGRNKKKNK